MRLLDVRHEQTATFAAEATGKLTRRPGLAVLTAGPGVTNGISAIAQAQFAGSPMVVVGGRAPQNRWGSGSLQELDQPPIIAPIAKLARTIPTADEVAAGMHEAFTAAGSSHRGPVFVDVPMDEFFNQGSGVVPVVGRSRGADPDPDAIAAVAATAGRRRAAGAHPRHRRLGRRRRARRSRPGRERRPARDHQRHGPRRGPRRPPAARHQGARPGPQRRRPRRRGRHAARLPPRLWHFRRQGRRCNAGLRGWCTSPTRPPRSRSTRSSPGRRTATSPRCSPTSATASTRPTRKPDWSAWVGDLQAGVRAAAERDRELLGAEADPIHPARIYGELVPRLADDSVVIGDGGDFVSFAGKYVEPKRPGGWLDPGPVRLPGRRARLGDRRPDRAAVGPGRAAARRRGGRASR